jgi:hypothetical protein
MSEKASRSIPNNNPLNTIRLIFRYPSLNDVPAIFHAIGSPRFPDKLPLKEMRSESEIEAWLKRLQANWAEGRMFSWILGAIFSKSWPSLSTITPEQSGSQKKVSPSAIRRPGKIAERVVEFVQEIAVQIDDLGHPRFGGVNRDLVLGWRPACDEVRHIDAALVLDTAPGIVHPYTVYGFNPPS